MELAELTEAVEAGDLDGQLGDVFEAVFDRAKVTEIEFGWRIKLSETDEWDAQSVTLQELAFAEKACSTRTNKVSYLELDPMRQMDHLLALIIAHLHHTGGLLISEATREVQKLTVTDLADIVSIYEVKGRPKAAAGTTSNGS
jgi:hypothetical protein